MSTFAGFGVAVPRWKIKRDAVRQQGGEADNPGGS